MDQNSEPSVLSFGQDTETPRVRREPEEDSSLTWGQVYDEQVIENHIFPSYIRMQMRDTSIDENYEGSPDRIFKEYEELGIPVTGHEHWATEFAEVGNENEHQRLLMRHQERFTAEQNLAELGGARAVGAMLASYGSDPAALAIDALTGGMAKGRLMMRLMKGAGQAMVANAAIEAALAADGESQRPEDIAMGFAAAAVFGGAFGGILGKTGAELEGVTEATNRSLRAAEALDTADAGGAPTGGSRHAGAAQNRAYPDLNDEVVTRTPELDEHRSYQDGGTFLGGIRLDVAAQLSRSKSQAARNLGELLVSNSTRRKAGDTVETAAETRAAMIRGTPDAELSRGVEPLFAEWYQRVNKTGKVRGFLKRQFDPDGRKAFGKQVADYIRSEGRTPIDPEVKKAVPHYQKFFDDMRKEANRVDAGEGKVLESNPWYVPQIMRRRKVNEVLEGVDYEQRREYLEKLIRGGVLSARRKGESLIDERLTDVVAKAYASRILRQGDSAEVGLRAWDRDLLDLDDVETLREFLLTDKVLDEAAEAEAEAILKSISGNAKARADAPVVDRLKTRLDMDMDYGIHIEGGKFVRLRELFDDDIDTLAFDYGRTIAGDVALREKGTSARKMRKALTEAHQEANASDLQQGADNAMTKADVDNLNYAFRAVMGQPLDDAGETARTLSGLGTAIGFITKMGSAAFNAGGEAFVIPAYVGLGRTLKNLPALKNIARELANKETGDPLYRQIMMLTGGVGDSLVRNMHGYRHTYDSSVPGHGILGQAQKVAEGGKRLAGYANMLGYVTDLTRKYLAVNTVSMLDDIMVHGKRAPSWWAKRLPSYGLDARRQQLLKDHLTNNVVRGERGALKDLNLQGMDGETYSAFQDFVYRMTSEGIQNVEAGNLPKFMSTPLGRVVMQFRSFTMAALPRHTVKDIQNHDTLAVAKFAYTTIGFMLMGYARAHIQHPFNDERREEAMEFDNILRTATGYAINSSLLPAVVDTASNLALGSPTWGKRRTSGLNTGLSVKNFAGNNPTLDYANDVSTALGIPGTFLRGGEMSRGQAAALFNIIGLDTAWQFSGLKNYALDQLPNQSDKTYKPIDIYGDD